MKFNRLNSKRNYMARIPNLDGGVDFSKSMNEIDDNQLTDCENVWWNGGVLKTREGMSFVNYSNFYTTTDEQNTNNVFYSANQTVINGRCGRFGVMIEHMPNNKDRCTIDFYYLNGEHEPLSSFTVNAPPSDFAQVITAPKNKQDYLYYCFHGSGNIFGYKDYSWEMINDVYIPTVLINAKGTLNRLNPTSPTGTLFEGFNLIGTKFKALFTTDNESLYYYLPEKGLNNKSVYIYYTNSSGINITYLISDGTNRSDLNLDNNNYACIDRVGGCVWFENTSRVPVPIGTAGISNNMTIIASKDTDMSEVFGMRIFEWFGGDRSGINGGTRLFMAGNSDKPNLIRWSDTNNPLYIPENNYVYIGEPSQPITALGKQSDMLVIFKEHEIYSTNYVSNGNISADDVLSGNIVDVSANKAMFPITQIHAYVGCDCPNTIQLCNNHLVWATSDGKVYALSRANQYSERNIVELSQPIERKLKEIKGKLSTANSCEYKGYYVLQAGNGFYLMDCKSNIYYSLTQLLSTTQKSVPWYVWKFSGDDEIMCLMSDGEQMTFIGHINHKHSRGIDHYRVIYKLDDNIDSQECRYTDSTLFFYPETDPEAPADYGVTISFFPVESFIQTKMFDFKDTNFYKSIDQLYIGIGNTGYGFSDVSKTLLSYITENGAIDDAQTIESNPIVDQYSPGYISVRRFTPNIRKAREFGIKILCTGVLSVNSISINYKLMGVVR